MKLIVGLGNPGKEYDKTRHNVGFMVVDDLAKQMGGGKFKIDRKFKAEIGEWLFDGEKVFVVKPLTFMNLSGEAIAKIMQFYRIDKKDVVVIHDDMDLALGSLRIRRNGSSGGHNGIKSIIEHVGQDFTRVRCGIESRSTSIKLQQEAADYVLSKFSKNESVHLREMLKRAVDAVFCLLKSGVDVTMNEFNVVKKT